MEIENEFLTVTLSDNSKIIVPAVRLVKKSLDETGIVDMEEGHDSDVFYILKLKIKELEKRLDKNLIERKDLYGQFNNLYDEFDRLYIKFADEGI